MKIIDDSLLKDLSDQASSNMRLRKNYNFHTSFDDPINRMLNAFEPGTYVRPHKHEKPDKREVFIVLRGRLAMFLFNETGEINQVVILDHQQGVYGVEVPRGIWHSIVSLKSGSVVYEVKDGPYRLEDDKHFAPWAPSEGSDEVESFMKRLVDHIE